MKILLFDDFLRISRKGLDTKEDKLALEKSRLFYLSCTENCDYYMFNGEKYNLYDYLHELLNHIDEITLL